MKTIKLTRGLEARVCDCHYELVRGFNWHAHPSHNKQHYAARTINKSAVNPKTHKQFMHELILGTKKGYVVDHTNQDALDNSCSNLRFATVSQNMANRVQKNGAKYRGVYWDNIQNKWMAQIRVNKKIKTLGRYLDEIEAAVAYNKAAMQFHKEFAVLNKGVGSW